jgi:hypothetical protein
VGPASSRSSHNAVTNDTLLGTRTRGTQNLLKISNELLDLVLDEVLNLLAELLNLLGKLRRADAELCASLMQDLLYIVDVGDVNLQVWDDSRLAALNGIATLINDVGVVARPATVPGKDLNPHQHLLVFIAISHYLRSWCWMEHQSEHPRWR